MRRIIVALLFLVPALGLGACRHAPPTAADSPDPAASALISGARGGGGGM